MPIFPGVDGVLFELLLVTPPRDPVDGCDGLQPADLDGGSGSARALRRTHLERSSTETTTAKKRSEPKKASVGGGETSLGESEGERKKSAALGGRLGVGRTAADSRSSCTFVGAVALLLSEVVGAWREMESPLFDSAGSVAGTIKLAARVLEGEARRSQQGAANKAALQEGGGDTGVAEALETAAGRSKTESVTVATGMLAASAKTEAAASPLATSELVRSRDDVVSPVDHMARPSGGPCERRGEPAPPSPCCDRSRGSCRGSRGPATAEPAEQRGFARCAAAAPEVHQLEPFRADEMAPRAVIIYKGVRLPFRWFRSGTAKGMDEALRDVLGELPFERRGGL